MFYQVNFEIMVHLDKAFEQLNVLKSVHIIYCTLNDSFAQQIVNLTKPFKLKSLFIDSTLQIMSLGLLLQKSDVYLESFAGYHGSDYDLSLKRKSLELIIKYCENIKFFNLCGFDKNLISLVSNLIENIKRYLNYLTIDICHLSNENSKNTFINKLIIMQMDHDEILHYIKEFIMKERRVKYLAFMNNKNGDLLYLKDEVEKFKLHNISVLSFRDLYFVKDLMIL
ncbi:hypothetical protein GLOIN_2v1781395 [Rhizophagus clarus]|uniref:Uncharacterized protein n=1 Tax=Rhizophagus clarus TaxID=94130 RepID=A0A8H3KTU6_9GLOM|nr:hypothetical protein GLOIN_2v1781395 [Rhizophagus clarus]